MQEAEQIGEFSQQTCEVSELEDSVFSEETKNKYMVTWEGSEAIDFLTKLNENDIYSNLLSSLIPTQTLHTKFIKTRDDAIMPSRAHSSDTGFDITIVGVLKKTSNVTFYSTGIKVQPPHGYYFELVPRSSISKTGYSLANNIGIIDQNYRGEIIVALRKNDEKADDLILPCKIAQLIPKQWFNMVFEEDVNITETVRDTGGFGSTS
jgi:dUTP pyrophosphatase